MSGISEDDPRIFYVPLEQLTAERTGMIRCMRDDWWVVHPDRGVVFWDQSRRRDLKKATPQANHQEQLSKLLAAKLYPFATVQQIPCVFLPIDPRDY